jgi:hypothetical protein
MKVRYAFKHTAAAPGAMFYTFKHTLHRLYRLLRCQSEKMALTKLTKPITMEALSSAVAYVEFAPSLDGVFFGRNYCDLLNGDLCPWVLRV